MTRVLGAILAGGQARRFGSDKALAMYEGRALIDHVAARLGAQVDTLAVCGRTHPGLIALADRPAPGLGPLGGLAAALHHAAAAGYDAVATAACDAPLLPGNLVATLAGPGAAYLAAQPVIGWWPSVLAPALDAYLVGEGRSMRGWAATAGARAVTLAVPLANVNTPGDLTALRGDQ